MKSKNYTQSFLPLRASYSLALFLTLSFSGNAVNILSEAFDGAWTSPAPTYGTTWTSDQGATSSRAWHRNSYTTNWSFGTSGSPSASGANATTYYARFHSYGVSSGLTAYLSTADINLASYNSGSLTFYYINPTGSDQLDVYFSNDGGVTWSASMGTYVGQASWNQKTISIPSSYQVTNFRIKFQATSDFGNDDIGLDEVVVSATPCATPSTQASNLTFANVTNVQMDIAWTNGNGSNRIVKMNTSNSFTSPVDGIDPAANSVYGGGEQVVYNGSSNTVTVTGLTQNTTYWFRVYEASCTGTNVLFATATGTNNPLSQTTIICSTPSTQASNITFTPSCQSSIVNWTNGNGTKRIVKVNTSNSFTAPIDGTDPSANSVYGGGEQVVYNGTSNNVTVTGLTAGTTYWFQVYEATCSGVDIKYATSAGANNPLSQATTAYTTLYWGGTGSALTGHPAGTNFNTAANWSTTTPAYTASGSAPDQCTNVIMTTNSGANVALSAGITVHDLTMNHSGSTASSFYLQASTSVLTINGNYSGNITGGSASNNLSLQGASSPGKIVHKGSATYGATAGTFYLCSPTASMSGQLIYQGDVIFNPGVQCSYMDAQTIFDAPVSQTIYYNSINSADVVGFSTGTTQIGSVNNPTVYIGGTGTQTLLTTYANLSINGTSVLDLGSSTFNEYASPNGHSLTIASGATLKCGGTSGGQTGSNFPVFASYTLNGTVEYNSTSAQTVYAPITYGNLVLTGSTKTAGAGLTVNGTTTINSTATLAAGAYAHNFKGDFNNNGTFTASTSTVNFSGSSAQTLSGSSTSTFYKLTLNNAAGLTFSTPANVSNALTLTSGLLNTTSANILTMQPGSTAPALTATSTSYVNGPMKYQKNTTASAALNFPIGKSPDCRPVTLTVAHTTASLYNYKAESFNADPWLAFGSGVNDMPATVDTISAVHYCTIARTDNAGASQPALDLSGNQTIQMFFGTNDYVYQGSSLTIVKNTSATPATWIDIGGSSTLGNFSTPQTGSVSSTSSPSAFNSFSSFALGSKTSGWNPLPIELLEFSVVPNGVKVDVKWSTATETNNKFFTIEKSKDGINFKRVINVLGAGNSQTLREYFESDYNPYEGVSYYRLKQTDYNGSFKYSFLVSVTYSAEKGVIVYPNPSNRNENSNVVIRGYEDQEVLVVLRDMSGQEFYSKVFIAEENNQLFAIEALKTIPAGTYIVVASSLDKVFHQKLIIR